jgi:hypothetical protein
LHPDKNKSPDANERFILLNEAYEYLQNLKTGKFYDQKRKSYQSPPKGKRTYEYWKNTEREKARNRAQHYAKMHYEEFIKTDFYTAIAHLNTIASQLGFFIALAVLIVLPIMTTILYGTLGLGVGVLINLIVLPMTISAIRGASLANFGTFFNSILYIVRTDGFIITTLTIVNVIMVFLFGLQTLINPWFLIILFVFLILIAYFTNLKYKDNNKFKFRFRTFCIAPLIVNLFFLINYVFSSNPMKETYRFQKDTQAYKRGKQENTYIHLENDVYSEYPGLRIFLDYEEMKYQNHITYTFKSGLLGFRVMTDHEFSP